MALYDSTGSLFATYDYDAWGKVLRVSDANGNLITSTTNFANINPFRYRGYYYDTDSELYYLQSRYYDPTTGRFVNGDVLINDSSVVCGINLFAYCNNNSIISKDPDGHLLRNAPRYRITSKGFKVDESTLFLSRTYCLLYAADFLYYHHDSNWWFIKKYKGMNHIRIAQELWFHALVYYSGNPVKSALNTIGIKWEWLDDKVQRAKEIEVNYDDDRAWIYKAVWWGGAVVKSALIRSRRVPCRIIKLLVL